MSVSRAVEWGVLLGMRKVETVEQMPEEYRQVVLKLLYALASTDDELEGGTAPRSVDQTHALNAHIDARVGAWRLDLAATYWLGREPG